MLWMLWGLMIRALTTENWLTEKCSTTCLKDTLAVRNTREIGKKDLILNDATPVIEVNPETYEVRADGELLTCEPAEVLPMAQRYFMF